MCAQVFAIREVTGSSQGSGAWPGTQGRAWKPVNPFAKSCMCKYVRTCKNVCTPSCVQCGYFPGEGL